VTAISMLLTIRLALCGPLALRYIVRRAGIKSGWKEIALLADTDRHGTTLLGLKRAATALGLQAHLLRTSYVGLQILPAPLLVHMREGHYEVLQACNQTAVVTGGILRQRTSRNIFIKQWSGVALVLYRDCAPGDSPYES
jgi:ABC-type bacteriocin/lantibiotic exporter with double-glycine peptidase domain